MALRVLYVVYWGATEPIGLGGTVRTAAELVREHGEEVFLVTFDKPADFAHPERRAAAHRILGDDVHWTNLGYTKYPLGLSTLWDLVKGTAYCSYVVLRYRIDVIHGRTYVGAVLGAIVSRALGVPFVCHPDGFWPEERVDDGVWRAGSAAVKVTRWLHWWAYRSADAIIVLSRRARDVVLNDPVVRRRGTPVEVLRTCVEVERFANPNGASAAKEPPANGASSRAPDESNPTHEAAPPRLVYLGSLGGRYATEQLFQFFRVVRSEHPDVVLRIVTRVPRDRIERWTHDAGLDGKDLEIVAAEVDEVPPLIGECDAGVFFLMPGLSSFATSATKVAEYLSAGLPVALTPGCGDLDLLVSEHRVGVVVERFDSAAYSAAAKALLELAREPDIAERCRAVARRYMSQTVSARAQASLHRTVAQSSKLAARADTASEPSE